MSRRLVDLHTHVLPFLDDGAQSYEESVRMLDIMIENGVDTVVATPHLSLEKDNIDEFIVKRDGVTDVLSRIIKDRKMPIKILKGFEVMYSESLSDVDLSKLVIEGTDYILIELSTRKSTPTLEATITDIMTMGYIPILAHVERYNYLIEGSDRLVKLINKGLITQVNASALNNDSYPYVDAMIKNNLVHLIASDAHNLENRVPNLVSNKVVDKFSDNQRSIVEDELLDIYKPKQIRKIFNKYI